MHKIPVRGRKSEWPKEALSTLAIVGGLMLTVFILVEFFLKVN